MKYIKAILGILLYISGILLINESVTKEGSFIISNILAVIFIAIECFALYKKNSDKKKSIMSGIRALLWIVLFYLMVFIG